MIKIINLGIGNVSSVQNMLKRSGYEAKIVNHGKELDAAEKIILPGVGSFDAAMKSIDNLGFREILHEKVIIEGIPILGICLGMQIMVEKSEEGSLEGLGWIKGETKKFNFSNSNTPLKIPHMGWNYINVIKKNSLFPQINHHHRFYFVHSYYVELSLDDQVISNTKYGINFTSSLNLNNIFGVQFHPEKSHRYGRELLENFCRI